MLSGDPKFENPTHGIWTLTKDGYTVTVTEAKAVVTNSHGIVVDESEFPANTFREARWMLDTAIEAGE